MSKRPRIIKRPTPDDLADIIDIYDDMVDLIVNKHPDKKEHVAPTLLYIVGISLHSKEDLKTAVYELTRVFDACQEQRKKNKGT